MAISKQKNCLFSTLPLELIDLVADTLEKKDILSLRLTSTELYNKLTPYFGRSYLASISSDLSPKSLQTIQDISKHDRLRHYVRALEIRSIRGILNFDFSWPRDVEGRLIAPLPGSETLQQALVNGLVRCRSFHFTDRSSNGYEPSKKSVHDETRRLRYGHAVGVCDAVGLLFSIFASAAFEVECFDFGGNNYYSAGDAWENERMLASLDEPINQALDFKAAWAKLQVLKLPYLISSRKNDWLLELASSAKGLRKLNLGFRFGNPYDFITRLIERTVPADPLWPCLRDLKLECMRINKELLLKFLSCFGNCLRVLDLEKTELELGSWVAFFGELDNITPHLEAISVGDLVDSPHLRRTTKFDTLIENPFVPGSQGRKFSFVEVPAKVYLGGWTLRATYRGSAMRAALEMLAASAGHLCY